MFARFTSTHVIFPMLLVAATASSCIPDILDKYRKESAVKDAGGTSESGSSASTTGTTAAVSPDSKERSTSTKRHGDAPQRATIYALDKQTFRFHMREEDVWNTALDVLLKNYNVTIVERQSGIITTEWDSYYLNNAVYRNKVSMRLRRQSTSIVDLTIMNGVERLRDASTAGSGVGAVWLPASDAANEVARIIQNMALALKQPPPVLPPGAVALQSNALEQPGTPITDFIDKSR